ncbi:hypothetical protein [Curtanaerobium respiraculi]|uniref:hypothetical protein n=1 Tax=Curtanaerobium respiraculi TaxID=2949669 RepID=UPI0024B326AF|nr:hypothetical protein [Curtanaerobium respiraculi]
MRDPSAARAGPAYLEAMELVNNLCSWLRRYLFRLPDMKKANMQSYPNWFVYLFHVGRDEGKWPKTERVLRHLLTTDSHYLQPIRITAAHGRLQTRTLRNSRKTIFQDTGKAVYAVA